MVSPELDRLKDFYGHTLKLIRSRLDIELRKHVNWNLNHYINVLEISDKKLPFSGRIKSSVYDSEKPLQSKWLKRWFKTKEDFPKNQSSERESLVDLIVAMHGFWIFFMDDTRNTFGFPPFFQSEDDCPIEFGKGISYKDELNRELQTIVGHQYLLRPGEGSLGLGVRNGVGVCLRDTIRDLKGSVAAEDCMMRNISYIGIPIFTEKEIKKTEKTSDNHDFMRRRAFAYFNLLFPAPNAWHPEYSDKKHRQEGCFKAKRCLFKMINKLCNTDIKPFALEIYKSILNESFGVKTFRISELAEDEKFLTLSDKKNRRKRFLGRVLGKGAHDGQLYPQKHMEDFLSVNAAQIWTRESSNKAGKNDDAKSHWNLSSLWNGGAGLEQSLIDSFPEIYSTVIDSTGEPSAKSLNQIDDLPKPWLILNEKRNELHLFPINLSIKEDEKDEKGMLWLLFDHDLKELQGSDSIKDLVSMVGKFWEVVHDIATKNPKEIDLFHPEFFRTETDSRTKQILKEKRKRLIETYGAKLLCNQILQPDQTEKISEWLIDSVSQKSLKTTLCHIFDNHTKLISFIQGAFLVLPQKWALDSIEIKGLKKLLAKRVLKELLYLPTISTYLNVLQSCEQIDGNVEILTNAIQGSKKLAGFSQNPIQSDSDFHQLSDPKNEKVKFFDFGAQTALASENIWNEWLKLPNIDSNDQKPLDMIYVKKENNGCLDMYLYNHEVTDKNANVILKWKKFMSAEVAEKAVQVTINRKGQSAVRPQYRPLIGGLRTELLGDFFLEIRGDGQKIEDKSSENSYGNNDNNDDAVAKDKSSAADCIVQNLERCNRFRKKYGEEQGNQDKDKGVYTTPTTYCAPILSYISGEWHIRSAHLDENGKEICEECICNNKKTKKKFIESFKRLIRNDEPSEPSKPIANLVGITPDFGFFTHILLPIASQKKVEDKVKGEEKSLVGFTIYSGSQQEHDTPKRICFRPEQMKLFHFASNYLEFAINQEMQHEEGLRNLELYLGGFTHSLRRRIRFTSTIESISNFHEQLISWIEEYVSNGKDVFTFLENEFYKTESSYYSDLLFFLQSTYGLPETKYDILNASILIDALTRVLAGKPEIPLDEIVSRGVADQIPGGAKNLFEWIKYVTKDCKDYEEGRLRGNSNGKFTIRYDKDFTSKAKEITFIPLASLLLIIEEVFRNAGKHAPQNSERVIFFSIIDQYTLMIQSNNTIFSPDQSRESTGFGKRTIERILESNFGLKIDGGWSYEFDDTTQYLLCITMNFTNYKNQFWRVWSK